MSGRVQLTLANEPEHRRQLAVAINNLLEGKINSTGAVTLTANVANTTVTDYRVGVESVILFMPLTANAATELYGATMYVTAANVTPLTNQFVITHANNAQADRAFRYIVIGSEIT
jgi:hypothetical protein